MLFKEIILIMEKGEHNTLPGLLKVLSLKVNLNKGLPESVKKEFRDIKAAILPLARKLKTPLNFNPNWIAGFITAEGSFFISLYPNDKRKAGCAISLSFSLSQHIKDVNLLERLSVFLDCGAVRIRSNKESAELVIAKSSDLMRRTKINSIIKKIQSFRYKVIRLWKI